MTPPCGGRRAGLGARGGLGLARLRPPAASGYDGDTRAIVGLGGCHWQEGLRGYTLDIADRMKGLAFIQVRAAREADGGLLDFSLASLEQLDRLIRRDVAPKPAEPEMLAEVIGAYLGETIVRRLGGRWLEEGGQPRVELGGLLLDPLRRAFLRVTEGEGRSVAAYFRAIEAAKERGALEGSVEDA